MSSSYNIIKSINNERFKSVYVSLFNNKNIALNYLSNFIEMRDKTTLTIMSDKDSFTADLDNNRLSSQHSSLNCLYFYKKKRLTTINNICKDLSLLKVTQNGNLCFLIPDIWFKTISESNLEQLINTFTEISSSRKLYIDILIYGSNHIEFIHKNLIKLNNKFSGIITFKQFNNSIINSFIEFWHTRKYIYSNCNYQLDYSNNCINQKSENYQNKTVQLNKKCRINTTIYINKTIINGKNTHLDNFYLINNNTELSNISDLLDTDTLVFSCSQQSEVIELTKSIFSLRKKHGQLLTILIKETVPCLRYSDEKMLLNAGVNLIIPSQVPFERFTVQMESMHNHLLLTQPVDNLDDIITSHITLSNIGYVSNNDFIIACKNILQKSSQSNIPYALIKLSLRSNITPEQCLSLCHIRRKGDVITACSDAIYILFGAIRHNDVDKTLNNLFGIPTDELFLEISKNHSAYDIENEYQHIINCAVNIEPDVAKLTTSLNNTLNSLASDNDSITPFAIKKTLPLRNH
ncbi:TPA: BcsE family c-di-GMP-binding protein [Photobacterium damselae]